MTGRPSIYTDELAAEICRRLSAGESLRSICRDDAMPVRETVRVWQRNNPAFAELYTAARIAQAEHMADELMDIADDGSNDFVDRVRQDGSTDRVLDVEAVMRSRLRVDTRKWFLSKVLPKIYGDKIGVEVGADSALLAIMEAARERVRQRNKAGGES
jgi:hypothetical protein